MGTRYSFNDSSVDMSNITPVKIGKYNAANDSGYKSATTVKRRVVSVVKQPRCLNVTKRLKDGDQNSLHALHYVAMILMASSLCFGLLIGRPSKDRDNMKYQSIAYGIRNVDQEKPILIDSESRKVLGGKRAAIQYYHEKNRSEQKVGA